jgi:hypothetical protein
MRRDERAYLWDVLQASDAIQQFVAGMDAQTYAATDVVHSAVERKFEVIGEALAQLSRLDPTLGDRIPNLAEIVAFPRFADPWLCLDRARTCIADRRTVLAGAARRHRRAFGRTGAELRSPPSTAPIAYAPSPGSIEVIARQVDVGLWA